MNPLDDKDILEFIQTLGDTERLSLLSALKHVDKDLRFNKLSHYEPYPKLKEFHAAGADYSEIMLMGSNQSGKALRNGTGVMTPAGLRPINELAVGDTVISGDGTVTTVTGVYPQGIKPIYRLSFSSGIIECCGEHLWKFKDELDCDWVVENTQFIIDNHNGNILVPGFGNANYDAHDFTDQYDGLICLNSIEDAGEAECTCISVAHEDRTFVTEHGIVTHNTYGGSYEMAYHLTGLYPDWWEGRRYDHAIVAIAGSVSIELTRKGMQRLLVGTPEQRSEWGSGSIPRHLIGKIQMKSGANNAIDTICVKHVSGEWSILKFASYEQGREKWQADTVHLIWFDEEPSMDIYTEGMTRTNVNSGLIMMTFTPLEGVTPVVSRFWPDCINKYVFRVQMGIKDALHYTEEQRERMLEQYPEHERGPRLYGIPQFGDGKVWNVQEKDIICSPFEIPKHFARGCGIDFGWDHPTGCVSLAWDRDADVIYVTAVYRKKKQNAIEIVAAVKDWGPLPWFWPHDGLQHEKGSGLQVAEQYKNAGLDMHEQHATHFTGGYGVEAGLMEILMMFETGKLKIFTTCFELLEEIRSYHRKDGKLVKLNDDLISAMRYAIMMKREWTVPREKKSEWMKEFSRDNVKRRW